MFDLDDENATRVKRKHDPFESEGGADGDEPEAERHELDSPENETLHRRLIGMYRQELDRQYTNRREMAIDQDYYDSIQWDEDDAQVLRERGQAPLVMNVIAQSINWIIGSEKRGRVDFKILPRGKEDAKPAERKTNLLKYLSDVNRTPFHRSRAFEDAAKCGIGWIEDGVQDDDEGEPVYSRYENWRNILWDSASTEMDLSDARYMTRTKVTDLDVAVALFPDRKFLLERASLESGTYGSIGDLTDSDEAMNSLEEHVEGAELGAMSEDDYGRRRVRLIEMWYRKPERVKKVVQGQFAGEIYDENNPGHAEAVQRGDAFVAERLDMRMHVAVMTTTGLLTNEVSPYRHGRFPFTPIWAYRRGRDGMPYGVIRGLRDLQVDINKRASKALYILSTNKIVMDDGAVEDVEELRQEAARPDAIIVKRANKELVLNVDRGLEQAHLDIMGRDISMIQQVSGVTDELLGRETNAQSGKAVEARQGQGMMSTATLFDNMRLATQLQGEIQLSLVEQFFNEQKTFRITNQRGNADFVDINDGLPENDIVRSKADFVISEDEWRATMRQAATEQLTEMISRMPPEVAIVMLDLVVESMDVPNREEIVKRIRNINGQRDPDATELTPEEQQRMADQAEQAAMQKAMLEADLREKLAKAGKTEAEAAKTAAELAGTNIDTQKTGLEAAKEALAKPEIARIADKLLREAGFVSQTEREAALAQAQREQDAMEQQQAAAAQPPQQPPGAAEQSAPPSQGQPAGPQRGLMA